MGGKRWSDAEEAVLAAIAKEGKPLIGQMHRLPGRTWDAAKNHGAIIGLSFSLAESWTDAEREILRGIYRGNVSIKVGVAKLLPHRTYTQAKGEAQRIGLSGTGTRRGRTGYSWVEKAMETVLADGQKFTVKQLAARTGAAVDTVQNMVQTQRGKKFRVAGWTRATLTGDWAAMWELGSGPDAPRPPRKTPTECCRDYRQKKRLRAGGLNPFASLAMQVAA